VTSQLTEKPSPAPETAAPSRVPSRRTRIFALGESRWAAAAVVLFLAGLGVRLAGGPAGVFWGLYLGCYAAGGWQPAWAGLRALREKTLDVDLLMIVAAIAAAAIGQVTDGALLIVIFATSGALEAIATARTADSVRGLLDLAPERATRLTEAGEEVVDAAALAAGDVLVVRPGERIGADGTVAGGASEVDQASITGEPLPADKSVGDEVFAGAVNGTGTLRVRVSRPAVESVVARIVAMVDEASATKAPTQLFIETIEQRYSVGVVAATLAIFAIPLAFGAPFAAALLRAMTFMIVASPCAVVLSTMPPLLSAISTAGRHGILVKSAVAMEQLAATSVVAMDKTGTLTTGAPRVADVRIRPDAGIAADELLALAGAAEYSSEHPLARAVVTAAREGGHRPGEAVDFQATPGRGIAATVAGYRIEVGSPARLLDATSRAAAVVQRIAGELETEGHTAVVVTLDGSPAGVLGIADRIRPDAATAVAALSAATGRAPILLTGDNERAARGLARQVGITEVRAGLLPHDKATTIQALERSGRRSLLIGDGINDAPALAAAHTGVAMGKAGSDLALESADAVVVRDELTAIPTVVSLARAAKRLVIQNLIIAAVVIAGLVIWDLAGHLPLPLGVAGHEGSTILVALNGLRLLRSGAWTRARDVLPG
jgi:heavy metal translocating P-type ATPase